jgi:chromosome condensin MukBEF ATPase and DNA-binding subunit MukB
MKSDVISGSRAFAIQGLEKTARRHSMVTFTENEAIARILEMRELEVMKVVFEIMGYNIYIFGLVFIDQTDKIS